MSIKMPDVLVGSFININTINPFIENRMKCIKHKGQKSRESNLHFCLVMYFMIFFNFNIFCADIECCVKIQVP